jgi:hypothetical protein
MGPKFFETRMGQTFYTATMPRLVKALEVLAGDVAALTAEVKALRAERPVPGDLLAPRCSKCGNRNCECA